MQEARIEWTNELEEVKTYSHCLKERKNTPGAKIMSGVNPKISATKEGGNSATFLL